MSSAWIAIASPSWAIAARDRGEVPLLLQVLIYPMLDDRTGSSRPAPPHIGKYVWTAEANRFGWGSLLGTRPGGAAVPAGAVPARVQNVAGLAPAFIGVGSIDLFVDEDLAYAQRLINAAVPTEVLVVPGAFHAFDALVPEAAVSKAFNAAWNAALTRAFATKASA
jgi:acetyl esterase/lipase